MQAQGEIANQRYAQPNRDNSKSAEGRKAGITSRTLTADAETAQENVSLRRKKPIQCSGKVRGSNGTVVVALHCL